MAKLGNLLKHTGVVLERKNPHDSVIRSPSPSANFIFGNGWGLPFGYSMVLYGPPKAGKTVWVNAIIGQLHKDYPEAVAIKYDTELRESSQNTEEHLKMWGIDSDRYVAYEVNEPDLVFDHIEKDVAAAVDDGINVKLIVIDSITGIQGRRTMNAESVMQQQIGDNALTIQEGLKRIVPVLRRKNIALIMTAHIRAELDMAEQMRGKKFKMAGSWALKHTAEYFVLVQPNQSKAGRTSLDGKEYVDDSVRDLMDNGEKFAHKIRVKMEDSSIGPKGRTGEFTLDYRRGIDNVHEEIFLLGVNRNVIEMPTNSSYVFEGTKWVGKANMLKAIKDNPELGQKILQTVRERDMAGNYQQEHAGKSEESSD